MGFLEVNVSFHLPDRFYSRRGVLVNAAALQHWFKLVLLSQATDKNQCSPEIDLCTELNMAIVSPCLQWHVWTGGTWKKPPPKPFHAWKPLGFFQWWNCICILLEALISISLPAILRSYNLFACRAPDHHQGMTKVWEIKPFSLGTFCLGRTGLCMKGNVLFFKLWFLTCFLGSELSSDGLAFERNVLCCSLAAGLHLLHPVVSTVQD